MKIKFPISASIAAVFLFVVCLSFGFPSDPAPPGAPDPEKEASALIAESPEASAWLDGQSAISYEQPKKAVTFDYRVDTITNAEKDTLLLPATFLSRFSYLITVYRTSLSGTHNVKIYLDESNATAATDNNHWRTIDSTSTTTATLGVLDGDEVYGRRHRIRVSGTGTQSSAYTIRSTYKYK